MKWWLTVGILGAARWTKGLGDAVYMIFLMMLITMLDAFAGAITDATSLSRALARLAAVWAKGIVDSVYMLSLMLLITLLEVPGTLANALSDGTSLTRALARRAAFSVCKRSPRLLRK